MNVTLLKPIGTNRVQKTYKIEDGKPVLSKAYDNAKTFNYSVVKIQDVQGLYKMFVKLKDANVMRIHGVPVDGLANPTYRRKVNFLNEGTRIFNIDADSWPIPKGFNLKTKKNIHATVMHLLVEEFGLDFLKGASCMVMLSNSTWSYYNKLTAHIYFILNEKVDLDLLEEWGKAYNSTLEKGYPYKIDQSVFRQVQPDYISKRICDGFTDPLPDDLRLTLHCDGLSPYVDKAVLTEHFQKEIDLAEKFEQVNTDYPVVKTKAGKELGATWEETLKLCGTAQHGINEPAYRACAQIVQSLGNKTVQDNLNYYVEKVFNLAWSSINSHAVRNGKKERDYYDKARVRGYLKTALEKHFGEDTDTANREIATAVQRVIGGANPSILFDNDLLEKYRLLRAKSPGKWATFRTVVKTKLKGRVTISDIDQALTSTSKPNLNFQIDQVIKSFNWIEGTFDKGLYCKKKKKKGYSLIGLDSGVDSDIYTKALELFEGNVPNQFEKNVLKVLSAKSRDEVASPFAPAIVETRCYSEVKENKNVLYYNMGCDEAGSMRTCVVTDDSIDVIPSNLSPVVWLTDGQTQECDIEEPESVFLNKDFLTTRKSKLKKFIKKFRRYVTAEDSEDVIDVLAWMVAATVNIGTAPILEISGASGDGKSTTALFIKELIDPTSAHIKEGPDLHQGFYKKEDLAKVLRARHITIFDNLSNLKPNIQDLLCSVATGWKYDLRLMYTQQFLALNIKKPLILTCLAPIITNQDLRSRSLSITVSKKHKVNSGDIYYNWESDKASMRLGLLCLVSQVIQDVNEKRLRGEDLNARDLWLHTAKTAVMKIANYKGGDEKEIEKTIALRKVSRDVQESLTSSASAHVIAWIYTDKDLFFKGNVPVRSTSELFIAFKKFIDETAGETLPVNGIPIEITLQKIPTNVRSFGILLSRIRNDIHSATGWMMSSKKSCGYKKIIFAKDVNHIIAKGI